MRKNLVFAFVLFILSTNIAPTYAQEKKTITWQDIPAWSYTRTSGSSLSPDGQWLAFVSGPTEGDLTLTLRHTSDTLKYEYPIGATASSAVFSDDGRYLAFRESASDKEAKAAKKAKKPTWTKLHIIHIADTQKVTFEKIKNFSFSGEKAEWIAIGFEQPEGGSSGEEAPKGHDVLLYHLGSKKSFNLGNVSEYAFNKAGTYVAYTIDATGLNGNGIFVRDLQTGITAALDNDKARYSRITWNEQGTAFALLKSNKNEKYEKPVFSIIGIKNIQGDHSEKVVYSGMDDDTFPVGQGISEHGGAYWTDDLNTLIFGISKLEKKKEDPKKENKPAVDSPTEASVDSATAAVTDSETKESSTAKKESPQPKKDDIEKPDMIIWNWQDTRLQSAQQVQQNRDKNFSYTSAYHVKDKRFTQLADSNIRSVNIGHKQLYGLGYDYTPYELESNLDGQRYADIYLINIGTGEKSILLERYYLNAARGLPFSPNGKLISYYADGAYYSLNLETRQNVNLTSSIPSSFIDEKDDHNVEKPATPVFGWSEDSKYVLIRDNFDLWKIPADAKNVVALTDNWKSQENQVSSIYRIYPDDKGIDLSKRQYLSIFNDKNKQAGIAVLEPGKNRLEVLFQDDHRYSGLTKAKHAERFTFTEENSVKSPEIRYASNPKLAGSTRQTDNTPDQEKYAWSSGVRLIDYVSAHGDTLQAALYLPADYVEGKSYPTITYIYERLTQGLNGYAMPAFPGGGFNRSVYTSNGYAVLMPDITYKLNEPGISAVACVVPAVEAAIATGVVDRERVGIHGHSWGGYQTSFLITQSDIFKAAAAGAPLTNMISMYSLIYWNSGSTNQSIFESSQGRLTSGYWDNWDAYSRNSPVYHIKNVNTPLLLLHNDKDGAVDYTQGIEYYNGLRRLKKPVVMITYKGENHGIVKEPNRKDYAVRMLEFFDHHLKGEVAPTWWEKGIDLLDLEKHLEERAF